MPNTLCYITGLIKDSSGVVLSGRLDVTLDANLEDQSTIPDGLLTRVTRSYIITNGIVDDPTVATPVGIGLLESTTQQVTYFFQFFRLISPGVYSTIPLFSFRALVPDIIATEFVGLARETGITTRNLSTGAIKVAREILTNPSLAPQIFYSSQVFRSDIKPVASVSGIINNNAIWIQPTRGIIWRYDEVRLKWKSLPREIQIGFRGVSVSSNYVRQVPWLEYPNVVLERIDLRFFAAAPNDVSNRWTIQPFYQTQASDTTIAIGSSTLTNASAAGTNIVISTLPNISFNATTLDNLGVNLTKLGSAGNLNFSTTFTYSHLEN